MGLWKMSTIKKCALYLRVSTDMQELENQRIALREFAKKKGYDIYKEYTDIMTGSYKSRPGFNNLFNNVHKGLFDVVIFWDLSRFSRSGALYTIQKLEQLQRLGVGYISYQEPYINSIGEFKDVIISLLATVAKMERQKISERTKAGLRRIRDQGKTLGRPKDSKDKKKRHRSVWKNPD